MNWEMIFVFIIIAVSAGLMASNRVRFDIVAILVVLSLMLSGVLTVGESLSGFGSSVVYLVAGLLIVGEMLDRTGVAAAMGDWILKKGGTSESRLLILIMLGAALLGAFMSSTAVVAIFIPIVLRISARSKLNSSRILLPMSYAAMISGMLTLIATTPNLVVSEELVTAGYSALGFFSFTPIGFIVLIGAVVYMLFIGSILLPDRSESTSIVGQGRSMVELWCAYHPNRQPRLIEVLSVASSDGRSILDSVLSERYDVDVIGLLRRKLGREERIALPSPDTELQSGDILLISCADTSLDQIVQSAEFKSVEAPEKDRQRWFWEIGAVPVLLHPESGLVGKTPEEVDFLSRYNLLMLGMRHNCQAVENFQQAKLCSADSLLVAGTWKAIKKLQSHHHDFVVLELPSEHQDIVQEYKRKPVALVILAAMVGLSILNIIPLVATVIIAALAAVFSRCLTMEDAYDSMHWSSLVLVAGMLPLADALEKTGGTDLIVSWLLAAIGDAGPHTLLTVLFFLTATLSLFLSNTAAAVLVAPIAIFTAEKMGLSPYPFAVAVLIGASAAFLTPVASPIVALVVEPGQYRFMDFVKAGSGLLLITYLVTLLMVPLMFPYAQM